MKPITIIYLARLASLAIVVLIAGQIMLFGGCTNAPVDNVATDYDNARRAAISAWEELIGPVSPKCYNRSVDAIVTEVGYLPESCIPPNGMLPGFYVGCYMPTEQWAGGDMIFLLEGRTKLATTDTAVHEYIHLLAFCEFGGTLLTAEISNQCSEDPLLDTSIFEFCLSIGGDPFHLDERLWDRYGPDTVEAYACASLEL